ncbi:MAG: glycosyltransferase family 2 protein [Pseudomonadota bacterium]
MPESMSATPSAVTSREADGVAARDGAARIDLSIIIPVYNEEANLPALYQKLHATIDVLGQTYEILFVDDGSSDDSRSVLCQLAAKDPHVQVIALRRNYGQTAAMMAGIDHAAGAILIPMDGDGQNDPADIPRLLEKLDEGYDVVSGWRADRKDNALTRTLPSRAGNWLISRISGVKLRDYGCSLKAYRRQVLDGVRLYGEMHRFIPIYASWQGGRVAEIAVNHHPRRHGKSSYGIERVAKVILDLCVIRFLDRYATKPIYVFGMFALLSFAIAGLSLAYMIYLKIAEDVSFIETPLPLLLVTTGSIGVLSILLGLIAELLVRTYYEAQSKLTYMLDRTERTD